MKYLSIFCSVLLLGCSEDVSDYQAWNYYGGDPAFTHYSSLEQITRDNVHQLEKAWEYNTGDAFPGSEIETNPLVMDSLLFIVSPTLRIIALHAATGKEIWSFNPYKGQEINRKKRNRGLALWQADGSESLYFTAEHFLYALHARTGLLVKEFGNNGKVDMRQGLGRPAEDLNVSATSPGIIYQDLIIMGSAVGEALPSAPGHIRAYNCRTGELEWIFHTIPQPGQEGYETWPPDAYKYIGGANNWTGMALDVERGIVFIPTGSAAFDFYGANRHGDNLYANCLLALNALTGEKIWHFQAVRHDVWDRDFPSPPLLLTIERNGEPIDAVAQITKSGHVYFFHRETGESIYPIEYINFPGSDVPGEQLAEKQPLPVKPEPFARQVLTEELITSRTAAARDSVLATLNTVRNGDQFTPPSIEGTVIFPGFDGGGEWGGPAFDPKTGIMYINSNEMAWILRLVKKSRETRATSSKELYMIQCAACHRPDMKGTPPEFPSLIEIGEKRSAADIQAVIKEGSGRMPANPDLSERAVDAITEYILSGTDTPLTLELQPESPIDLAYTHDGYNKFLDPEGYPAVKPPWGTLNALDVNSGEYLWQVPLGEYPELAAQGNDSTGSENYGGPVVTAGGLIFIGATIYDSKFRAFDKATGELLWETKLPASATATPATYQVEGKQYVITAAGGGKWGAPSGGSYVVFALPD